MKIATKLTLFLTGVLVLFVGVATALIRQTEYVAAGYDALLARPVRAADRARVMQVDFKKQVQEWKDILLRGHTPVDLDKYTKHFHDQQKATEIGVAMLLIELDDAEARRLVTEFAMAHRSLSDSYAEAYQIFVNGGFDAKTADRMVRGLDRPPTDLCDKVVARLGDAVKESVAAHRAAVTQARRRALEIAGVLLLVLAGAGLAIVHSILGRLGKLKAVSDRLAQADIDGLAIDITGRDEVGAFGESMKGVLAAVEELTALANSAQSRASA